MEGWKSIFASRTFYGALVAILGGLGGLFGYQFAPEDQTTLVETISGIAALVGGVLAIWGRVRATKAIGPPI